MLKGLWQPSTNIGLSVEGELLLHVQSVIEGNGVRTTYGFVLDPVAQLFFTPSRHFLSGTAAGRGYMSRLLWHTGCHVITVVNRIARLDAQYLQSLLDLVHRVDWQRRFHCIHWQRVLGVECG